jgi:hypothetical protein
MPAYFTAFGQNNQNNSFLVRKKYIDDSSARGKISSQANGTKPERGINNEHQF